MCYKNVIQLIIAHLMKQWWRRIFKLAITAKHFVAFDSDLICITVTVAQYINSRWTQHYHNNSTCMYYDLSIVI